MMTSYRNPDDFLDAWLRGVVLAGIEWFGTGEWPDTSVELTKWDYCPHYEKIANGIMTMSHTDSAFLIAMYSFYNPTHAVELAKTVQLNMTPGRLSGLFAAARRDVIARLLVSYEGW